MRSTIWKLVCPLLLLPVLSAWAQLDIRITTKRNLYVRYEPVVVNVEITNNAGRDVFLTSDPGRPWFGMEVLMEDGRALAPMSADYEIPPLLIEKGNRVKRSINLTPLFPIDDQGLYRIRAMVYSIAAGRYFTSNRINFSVIEGLTIWRKDFGVPEGMENEGQTRSVQLLSHRLPTKRVLYIRISNPQTGTIYRMTELGQLATYIEVPQIFSDELNNIHILQLSAPKTFIYTKLDLNGAILDRKPIYDARTRPKLKREESGHVRLIGGSSTPDAAPGAPGTAAPNGVPRASDRPAGLPIESQ